MKERRGLRPRLSVEVTDMSKYRVAEHFASINGESARAGEPAYFVRFTGCNLQCSYCDTAWANSPDASFTPMTAEEILQAIRNSGLRDVTLTGGEPLLQEGMKELLSVLLEEEDLRIEIETNGSVDLQPFTDLNGKRPVFTLDYKLPGSGMENFMNTANYRLLQKEDAVKFVVSDQADLERAAEIIGEYALNERCQVFLSPVFGKIDPETIVQFMLSRRMNGTRLNLQLHKIIWDPDRRGV